MEANGRESQHASFLAADLVNQTATRLDRAELPSLEQCLRQLAHARFSPEGIAELVAIADAVVEDANVPSRTARLRTLASVPQAYKVAREREPSRRRRK